MREVLIYDPKQDKVVPRHSINQEKPVGLTIVPDIQPYRSMLSGQMIQGRRQHRDHLRDHDATEIGNEKQTFKRPETYLPIRETLERTWHQLGGSD